jgi:hypothetical protein
MLSSSYHLHIAWFIDWDPICVDGQSNLTYTSLQQQSKPKADNLDKNKGNSKRKNEDGESASDFEPESENSSQEHDDSSERATKRQKTGGQGSRNVDTAETKLSAPENQPQQQFDSRAPSSKQQAVNGNSDAMDVDSTAAALPYVVLLLFIIWISFLISLLVMT